MAFDFPQCITILNCLLLLQLWGRKVLAEFTEANSLGAYFSSKFERFHQKPNYVPTWLVRFC